MKIADALTTALAILQTGERVELQPAKDGAEVYILKRRRVKQKIAPRPECGTGGTESG